MKASRLDPALLVVLGGVTAALHVGKLPTAIPVLRDALGISLVEAGFLLSLVQLAGMVLGLAVGLASDSIGLKRTMLAGLAMLTAASLLGGTATDAGTLMVLRGAEGFGVLLASMPAPGLIRRLVAPERVSAALGLWGAYMPLGTALALLCGAPVMARIGWEGWWWLLAGLSAMLAVWIGVALPADPPKGHARVNGWGSRLARTLRASGPWLVALSFAVYSAQWLAVIGFLPSMYTQAGLGAALAGAATAAVALGNMVGNIASGRLLQKGVAPERLLATGFTVMAAGGLLAFSPLPESLPAAAAAGIRYVAVLGFSMVGGLIPGTLFSLAVKLAPGEDTVSTTVGWMQQWSSAGQFAGPPLVAMVASWSGGWQWSGVVTGAFAAAGLFLGAMVGRRRKATQ